VGPRRSVPRSAAELHPRGGGSGSRTRVAGMPTAVMSSPGPCCTPRRACPRGPTRCAAGAGRPAFRRGRLLRLGEPALDRASVVGVPGVEPTGASTRSGVVDPADEVRPDAAQHRAGQVVIGLQVRERVGSTGAGWTAGRPTAAVAPAAHRWSAGRGPPSAPRSSPRPSRSCATPVARRRRGPASTPAGPRLKVTWPQRTRKAGARDRSPGRAAGGCLPLPVSMRRQRFAGS